MQRALVVERAGAVAATAESTRLGAVVVTGIQSAVPIGELPSAIMVIDREEIDSRSITDVL